MASAIIKINGIAGSNTDLPLNAIVQLDNQNSGGELTYLWSILDQPPGAVDSLSATNIQNPTFTPRKEGTYLIKLIVNESLISEVTDTRTAAVRQVKIRKRIPAAQETVESDASRGWATDVGTFLQFLDSTVADPGVIVGVAGAAGMLKGNIVRATASVTIKSGLPGAENLPSFVTAPATTASNLDELLGVLEGGVDGSVSPGSGALIRVRIFGRYSASVTGASAVVGEPVFVSNTATMVRGTPGTNRRVIGSVCAVDFGGANTFDVMFSGNIIEPTVVNPVDTDAAAVDTLLTTTGPTVVVTFTPSVVSNKVVQVYYRVITGSTNLTVTITYTDGSGAQTYTLVPLALQTIGSYILTPVYINSTASAITVTATAGTANRVFVSASILDVS